MGLDPRLIRYSVVKLGDKLEDIADVSGIAPWGSGDQAASSKVEVSPQSAQKDGNRWDAMISAGEEKNQDHLKGILNLLDGK